MINSCILRLRDLSDNIRRSSHASDKSKLQGGTLRMGTSCVFSRNREEVFFPTSRVSSSRSPSTTSLCQMNSEQFPGAKISMVELNDPSAPNTTLRCDMKRSGCCFTRSCGWCRSSSFPCYSPPILCTPGVVDGAHRRDVVSAAWAFEGLGTTVVRRRGSRFRRRFCGWWRSRRFLAGVRSGEYRVGTLGYWKVVRE